MISYQREVAIKIDDSVLAITPTSSGRMKLRIVEPQMISSGIMTMTVVRDVIIERPSV